MTESPAANDNRRPEEVVNEILGRWRRARAAIQQRDAESPPPHRPADEHDTGR